MVLSSSFFLISPLPYFQKVTFFPEMPLVSLKNSFRVLRCSSSGTPPGSQQDILNFVAESRGKTLPCVRTYENDLVRLSLVGDVSFDQALTAAAADGGKVATEHLDSGIPAMVVETVFPGPSDPHATVSTRLFLPAREVKEKANKLKKSLSKDILSGTISKNILAMTFRQVVLQKLSNFELVLFPPGTERDMGDLENSREVPVSFTLSASNEEVISVIAEIICISALQSTERHFLDKSLERTSNSFFHWFKKHRRIASKDSSVVIYQLFEDEIVGNAKSLLENFNSLKGTFKPIVKPKSHWWKPPAYFKLENMGGPQFASWIIECLPAYQVEIDTNKLKNVKFEGWIKSTENLWEVLLTHSQMVRLADALDMYFEDIYSLPNKDLPCEVVSNYVNFSRIKKGSSLLKIMYAIIASGILLITIFSLGQLSLPYQSKRNKFLRELWSPISTLIKSKTH